MNQDHPDQERNNSMAERIAIITDSCTDLPEEIAKTHPVFTVALHVNYEKESFLDRVEITPQEVYDRFDTEIPTTSTPSVDQVTSVFEQVIKEGYTHALCIDISSGLSGTYEIVEHAASQFPQITTATVDTLNIGFGSGITVMYACELLDKGLPFQEIADKVQAIVPKTHTFFLVETLEYLFKGGRIGKVTYSLGSVLNLKPVITCDAEGKYVTAGKARGRKGALKKAKELVAKVTEGRPFRLAVANGNAEEEAAEILGSISKDFPNLKSVMDGGQISPVLTVHTGPGLIGLIIQMGYEN